MTYRHLPQGYEERAYPAAKWVCHSQVQQAASRRKDTRSFFALFRYIDGGNEAGEWVGFGSALRG